MLFVDEDGNRRPDSSDEILRVDLEPTSRHLRVVSTVGRQQLRYLPDGRSAGSNLTLSICNRQGEVLSGEESARVLEMLKSDAMRSYDHYEAMLSQDGQQGLARELARMNLPANIYTQWYWKVDLHNLFHFLRLRADPHAQYEIRVYAEAIAACVRDWVPLAFGAFEDYRMNAVTLSSMEIEALREYFAACQPDREHDGWPEPKGLSERESGEFFRKLGLMK